MADHWGMDIIDPPRESFVSLRRTAARIGVPVNWLRGEAQADRVPHLRVGRRMLFSVEAVERALIERMEQSMGVASRA